MRLLVVTGLTLVLLLGAVPLAVPGTSPLPAVPPAVGASAFVVAGLALFGGLVLLARSRLVRDRAEDEAPAVAVTPVAPVAPAVPEYVTVRTRW